jgi:hypothetical protein
MPCEEVRHNLIYCFSKTQDRVKIKGKEIRKE